MSVYMIIPNCEHDEADVYYGHTSADHKHRFSQHKCSYIRYCQGLYNNCYVFSIFEKYGVDNCCIVLLHKFDNVEEAIVKEREYILNNPCVNKQIPLRDKAEYRKDNLERINEKDREYRKNGRYKKYYERIDCECGGHYIKTCKLRHLRSKKHNEYIYG